MNADEKNLGGMSTMPEPHTFPGTVQHPFPFPMEDRPVDTMSLRAYLAGQVICGMIANDPRNVTQTGTEYCSLIAKGCVNLADALIAELEKP